MYSLQTSSASELCSNGLWSIMASTGLQQKSLTANMGGSVTNANKQQIPTTPNAAFWNEKKNLILPET